MNLADNARNDAEPFTVLGTVIEGMTVLDSLYGGYGEESGSGVRQGRQGPLERGGNAYMDRVYPRLDRIWRVTVSNPPQGDTTQGQSVCARWQQKMVDTKVQVGDKILFLPTSR